MSKDDITIHDSRELEEETPGERGLWRAVITQALMDASSNSKKREMKLIKAQAISWLSGTSQDFFDVCALADMDPDYVRSRAKEALKRGCNWRAYNPNSYDRPRKKEPSDSLKPTTTMLLVSVATQGIL